MMMKVCPGHDSLVVKASLSLDDRCLLVRAVCRSRHLAPDQDCVTASVSLLMSQVGISTSLCRSALCQLSLTSASASRVSSSPGPSDRQAVDDKHNTFKSGIHF